MCNRFRSSTIGAFFFGLIFSGLSLSASEKIETNDFSVVAEKVRGLVEKHSTSKVLVAYDLDNTLLYPKDYLGSDPWYDWKTDGLPSKEFLRILNISDHLTPFIKMDPPEPEIPQIVKALQDKGLTSIAVTARNYNKMNGTLYQLRANSIDFRRTALEVPVAGRFIPYDLNDPEKSGLTKAEAMTLLNNKKAREVLYSDGVFYTSGLHKGAVMRNLLHLARRTFDGIVFVDDKLKHCNRVYAAFDPVGVDVVTIHYRAMDSYVKEFHRNHKHKEKTERDLQAFLETIEGVFGKKL